jgi:adenylosuccinate synthase
MNMGYFSSNGVHVLVDGQYGSTGKGLYASYLAHKAYEKGHQFDGVISNAGPNSGHTFYHDGEKHVLKQLPTFAVKMALMGQPIPVYLSAGAVISPEILAAEARKYPAIPIWVHTNAAVIDAKDKDTEQKGSIAAVAGTRSGTGSAIARKVLREPDAVWASWRGDMPGNVSDYVFPPGVSRAPFFMEVSQGFSLGLHDAFYPKVTSRECTVAQGIADARISPFWVRKTFMVIRTYPIRVGNVDGYSSGDHYPDQEETSWEALGVDAERTTVTNRIRRVFTFSEMQFKDALRANTPDFVLVNFMNYLKDGHEQAAFKRRIERCLEEVGLRDTARIEYGFGPNDNDITPF